MDVTRRAVNNGLDALDVRFPCAVAASVGVADLYTESYALTAKFAFCHLLHLLALHLIISLSRPEKGDDNFVI